MRSRLAPMKKVARMLRQHRPLLLNWFRARGEVSAGIVEGFNNKAKLTTRKAYGFRSYDVLKNIMQSIFSSAARRQDAESGRGAHRRDGGLKMDRTKPLAGCLTYGD